MIELKEEINEIIVRTGKFIAGNTRKDKEGWEIEHPVHEIFLTYDFTVQNTPITFTEYEKFCKDQDIQSPSDFCPKVGYALGRREKPVLNVSWWDAIAYCNWLSLEKNFPVSYRLRDQENPGMFIDETNRITKDVRETKGYRLLTEAEWEYSARGGHLMSNDLKYSGSNSLEVVGWYWKNSGVRTIRLPEKKWNAKTVIKNKATPQEIKKKKPNILMIYDMSGNVWEWCHDWFGEYSKETLRNPTGQKFGNQKVVRGGSWFFGKHFCRVSSRFYTSPNYQDFQTGFRIARTLHE